MACIRTIERATLKVHLSQGSIGWFRTTGWHVEVGMFTELVATPKSCGSTSVRFGICKKDASGAWYVVQHVEATAEEVFELNVGNEEFFVFSEMRAGKDDWIVNSGEYGWSSTIVDPSAKWAALDWCAPHTHGLFIASA